MPLPDSLRFPYRVLAIAVAALLPAGIVIWQLVTVLDNDTAAARRARGNIEHVVAIKTFTQAALEHRDAAAKFVDGGEQAGGTVLTQTEQVEAALASLETEGARHGNEETRRLFGELRHEWQQLRSGLEGWARRGDFESFWRHAVSLLRHARELAAIAEAGARARALVLLLDDADDLSQTAILARRAARDRRLDSAAEARLHRLLGRLDESAAAQRRELEIADAHAMVRDALRGQEESRARIIQRLEADILRDGALVNDRAVAAADAARRVADQVFELFDPLARTLDDRLRQHIALREHTTTRAGAGLLISTTIALLTAYLIGRSLARPAGVSPPAGGDRLRALAGRAQELADSVSAAGLAPEAPAFASHAARLSAAAREVALAARQLDEVADETSVAALNVAIEAAAAGATAVPVVEQLADRASAATLRVSTLAEAVESEAAALVAALAEASSGLAPSPNEAAARLAALAGELRAAAGMPPA